MSRVVLQDLSDGSTRLVAAPAPAVGRSGVLIATQASLVSAGTERMLVDFGRASLLGKVRSQPQRVGEVIDKARTDGIGVTVDAVRSKLAQPIPLGYSSAGVVLEVGRDVRGLAVGDLVAAAGPHAETATVPVNLTAVVPAGVAPVDAAFATVGSIALQGLRLANPTVGERVVVIGLGLIGLLAVQLLQAQGCLVLGIDPNPDRRRLAEGFGAATVAPGDDVEQAAAAHSHGRGVDAVLVCASTTSSEPIHQAAQMCRQRGRIVLVGVTGLELDRADFYEKELTFQVSAAYGPGRYDPTYESGGIDYPVGFVRWTAGRNMEAVLDLIGSGRLDVASLVTHRFAFDDAPDAYQALVTDRDALGIVLTYPERAATEPAAGELVARRLDVRTGRAASGQARLGVLGAGNFATQVLLPAFRDAGATVDTIVSRGGTSAAVAAATFGARHASSDAADVFDRPEIDTVVVATRHDTHAGYVERALRAGKHVFVEKPVAIDAEQLADLRGCIEELSTAGGPLPLLGVGFNRRFAPVTRRMVELLATRTGPKALTLTMNAGAIPANHWTQDRAEGGGRLVGEACHLIDLARFLVGSPIASLASVGLDQPGHDGPTDTASILLTFDDGSIATVNYFANGSKRYPKERVEVFAGGRVLVNDNFRTLRAYGWPGVRTSRVRGLDKGHAACAAAFVAAVRAGGPPPIPLAEVLEVTEVSLRAAQLH
ncbi:MAG: bi-domain-containing oxidoreductase [Acidimicrobiales bacterium]|nr:bi-domain-containing oxidoreductase [Actinomycetota bacterium]